MKNILYIILMLATSLQVEAQRVIRKGSVPDKKSTVQTKQNFNVSELSGYWQEIERSTDEHKKISFTDTLNLHFYAKDSVRYKSGKFLTKRGVVEWNGEALIIAGNQYALVQFTPEKLVLFDYDNVRTFQKIDVKVGEGNAFEKPKETKITSIDSKLLQGEWSVYRTKSAPGAQIIGPLRTLLFENMLSTNNYSGNMMQSEKGKIVQKKVNFNIKETTLLITGENTNLNFEILTLTNTELIIRDSNQTLYFKKL